jgi:hypothetical protein
MTDSDVTVESAVALLGKIKMWKESCASPYIAVSLRNVRVLSVSLFDNYSK